MPLSVYLSSLLCMLFHSLDALFTSLLETVVASFRPFCSTATGLSTLPTLDGSNGTLRLTLGIDLIALL